MLFRFFAVKNIKITYFDQRLECAAPKQWLKYTTSMEYWRNWWHIYTSLGTWENSILTKSKKLLNLHLCIGYYPIPTWSAKNDVRNSFRNKSRSDMCHEACRLEEDDCTNNDLNDSNNDDNSCANYHLKWPVFILLTNQCSHFQIGKTLLQQIRSKPGAANLLSSVQNPGRNFAKEKKENIWCSKQTIVVYFNQLLGAACRRKLVKTFLSRFQPFLFFLNLIFNISQYWLNKI